MKLLLIVLGTLSVGLGVLGIFLPGLPTTPFLLLSAGLYARSSDKLYQKLIHSPFLGKFIRDYQKNRAIPLKVKWISILTMWSMIMLSIFLVGSFLFTIIIVIVGIIGTLVMGFWIKTL